MPIDRRLRQRIPLTVIPLAAISLAALSGCTPPSREEFNAGIGTSPSGLSKASSYVVPRPMAAVLKDISGRAQSCFSRTRANATTMQADLHNVTVQSKGSDAAEISLIMNGHYMLTADLKSQGSNATQVQVRQFNAWSNGEATSIKAWAHGENAACKYGPLELPFG